MIADENSISLPFPVEKLAKGLQKAREFRGISLTFCSSLMGIPSSKLKNYENGKYIPSLPELESFSFIYGIPLAALFFPDNFPDIYKVPDADSLKQLLEVRKHIISTKLQIAFDNINKSVKEISTLSGISKPKLKRYLGGISLIPVDDLQALSTTLELGIKDLLDSESAVGIWQEIQRKKQIFFQLPKSIQDFMNENGNWSFLETTEKIKQLDKEKLEMVSESILQLLKIITSEYENKIDSD